ncbi:MAG: helix-turn-helix domain-containing protein [Glaciihabitans sp.]
MTIPLRPQSTRHLTADLHHIDDEECHRFQSSVELIGKRWSSGIMLAIARGAHRFTEIIAVVPGLSDRLLAQRIKELEAAGMLERIVISSTPVQVRYRLTERGSDLLASLQPLMAWAQRWEPALDDTTAATG